MTANAETAAPAAAAPPNVAESTPASHAETATAPAAAAPPNVVEPTTGSPAETTTAPAAAAPPNVAESTPANHAETTTAPAAAAPPNVVESTTASPAATPLSELFAELPQILQDADYREMWGVELTDTTNVPTTIVLQKFLRANNNDVTKTKTQLTDALKWRKEMQPLKLLADMEFDKQKFWDLGFVTAYENKTAGGKKEIITWNIYGAVKDVKGTFGDVDEFIKWRTALMELSIRELNLPAATEKIPSDGEDPYRMIQVHDYLGVSFLRMDPNIRAASKATIQTFSTAYPELLKYKFFVNLPLAMSWVFAALRLFLSAETVKKFHPLSYGSNLAGEIPEFGELLPQAYGGKGVPLNEIGLVVRYGNSEAVSK